ncbi:MAG: response regulator [Actinobacteria bacterium]|nr:response regulator [Actinomycetota bacterium]
MTGKCEGSVIEILLIEDNQGDARLTEEALKDGNICFELHVVEDGLEALLFLRGEGKYARRTVPDLILLDLNLPVMDGRELLVKLKEDEKLRMIPVIVLTASKSENDIARSYDSQANAYITKPADLDQFSDVIKAVEDFWLTVVRLPSVRHKSNMDNHQKHGSGV